jgi:hypothetical protein
VVISTKTEFTLIRDTVLYQRYDNRLPEMLFFRFLGSTGLPLQGRLMVGLCPGRRRIGIEESFHDLVSPRMDPDTTPWWNQGVRKAWLRILGGVLE